MEIIVSEKLEVFDGSFPYFVSFNHILINLILWLSDASNDAIEIE
jgi:hypothetical protein